MATLAELLLAAGTKIMKPRGQVAAPLPLMPAPRPLPPMRPLQVIGDELFPASGLRIYQRTRSPGSIYPDEIEAIEAVLPSLRQDMEDGIAAGYDQWYHTGPLQERFREGLGRERGDREFRRAMGLMSASSNATPVEQEIKKGSLLYMLQRQGQFPRTSDYDEAIRRVREARERGVIPPGYGGFAQGQDFHQANKFLGGGALRFPNEAGAKARYKIGDYYNQKIGDPDAAAMDTWMHRWLGLPFESRAYTPARQAILHAAGDVPISEAQPAIWMQRGARSPGMDSLSEPSFLHWFERRLLKRAEELGQDPDDVLDDVISGRQYLATPQEWPKGAV